MLPGKKYGVPDYVVIAKRYWWIVASTTFIAAFVALIISATRKDSYQSEMLVQIVPQRVPETLVQPTITVHTEERMNSLEAQVKSRSQLERLIREFDLYPDDLAKLPMEDVVAKMRSAIVIQLIRPMAHLPADAFFVRFTYGDPDLAARVTSALGNVFIAQNAKEREDLSSAASQFFDSELADTKAKLAEQERKVEHFRKEHAGRLPTQSDFNLQAMQTTQAQLQALVEATARDRDRRDMLERLYNAAVAEPPPTPAATVVAPATPNADASSATLSLSQQLQSAKAVLERLEARLKPEHPDLRRQRRLVADLERRVAAEPAPATDTTAARPTTTTQATVTEAELQRRDRLRTMKAEIDSLASQITFKESEQARIRGALATYQSRLEAIPGVESEWIALTRDYETLKSSYENMLKKSQDSKVAANLEKQQVGEQFKIVDAARVPVRPVGPIRMQINGIGTVAGLMLGVLIVAFLFFRDTTFRSEGDVLDVLALPVLALVPLVTDPTELRRGRRRKVMLRSAVAVAALSCGYVAWTMQLWRFVK